MLVKMGVPYHDVSRGIRRAWPIVDRVFIEMVGREAILTSTTEGDHRVDSLHYDTVKYGASDFRLRDVPFGERDAIRLRVKSELAARFGARQYDVVFSKNDTCLHVEYEGR